MNKTTWIYGNRTSLGWGATEVNLDDYATLDFDPEFECKSDVRTYWRNRSDILALPKMSLYKYIRTLVRGIILYRKLLN